jgi:hypothetical protein
MQAEFLVSGDVAPNLIMGFGCYNAIDKNKLIDLGIQESKIKVIPNAYEIVKNHIENNKELLAIASKTIVFLRGFYSDFALELLSSIDYISIKEDTFDKQTILKGLEKWNYRKRTLFSNPKYLEVSLRHLKSTSLE